MAKKKEKETVSVSRFIIQVTRYSDNTIYVSEEQINFNTYELIGLLATTKDKFIIKMLEQQNKTPTHD